MKWNDVELIDGEFYFVEVKRWGDGLPNNWVFAYKDNMEFETNHYVCVKIEGAANHVRYIYGDCNHVCCSDSIISLRPATREDMDAFWYYLDRWGCRYNVNTKKLRYVGC